MFGRQIILSILLMLPLLLASCTPPVYRETEQKYANTQGELAIAHAKYDHKVIPSHVLTARDITLGNIHLQPAWLHKQITVRGNKLPFEVFVNKILSSTSGNATYDNGVNRTVAITLNYSGSIKGALDALAAKTNYAYDLNGDTLVWSGFLTKTFDISFMPGASQYLLGRKAGGDTNAANATAGVATGMSNSSQYSSLQGSLSVWNDLKAALESMKSKEGQVIVSEATTTITVRDRPENVRVIGNYLASMDKNMSQEVALEVQVLEVSLDKSFNYGINWNLVRNFMHGQASVSVGNIAGATGGAEPFNLQALGNSASTLGIGILSKVSSLWGGTQLFINAIAQQGKVSVSTQPRVITLNNQVAEIGINRQTTYLSQVTSTNTINVGNSVTLTPAVVSAGFSLYLLPKIQGNNVYLQISSTLSNLERMDKFGTGTNQIQLPVVAEKRFNQRTVLTTGSTLILAGFKQLNNTANKVTMFESDALGGKGGSQGSTETIVLITPTIIRVNQ